MSYLRVSGRIIGMLSTTINASKISSVSKLIQGIMAGMLLSATGQVSAAPQQTALSEVIAPECTLSASPVVMDFGTRSRGQLQDSATGRFSFGSRTVGVSASCTISRAMLVRIEGPAKGGKFSWGNADSQLRVSVRDAQVDGKEVQFRRTTTTSHSSDHDMLVHPGDTLIFTRDQEAIRGRNLTLTLQIEPMAGQHDARPLRQGSLETSIHVALVP
ncbi:hypothetical protein [Serratia fonticola]|uniref:hypothetical protein n=1 Tax=Serratia fonticola TaxID=47917 RepID=UPI0024DE9E42|nr:hypothetical protein [Serratia fonticola]MDK2375043.1 hypothetical protein [Serratia fonticola]